MEHTKLSDIVNQSGFPLQIGVAQHVLDTRERHGWKVLYTEHSWKSATSDSDGFIDLVLEDMNGTSVMIVECKRVLESPWIFLNSDKSMRTRRHAKAWVTSYISGNNGYYGWMDFTLEPSSPESQFCVVFGQDAKSKPMLERVAADVVSATEGLAEEEHPYQKQKKDALRAYFSVIVTTAQLKLCSFDPRTISLSDGKFITSSSQNIPYIRFRKQLSTKSPKLNFKDGLATLASSKEHTVFVVNAESLSDFLTEFEVDRF